jgi:hypothetical protein
LANFRPQLGGTRFADPTRMKKWIGHVSLRETIRLSLLLLLLCTSGLARGQSLGLNRTVIRRAERFEPIIVDAAERHGVNPHLLWVIAYLETRFNPKLRSRVGARGLMQFMPATALSYGLANPYDPTASIDAAARYVRDLAARFSNRADLTLAAYNSGEGTVEAFLSGRTLKIGEKVINPRGIVTGGIPPYRETQNYVQQGIRLLEMLTTLSSFIVRQPASADNDESSINKERDSPRDNTRKSIRANTEQEQAETEPDKSKRVLTRRSIYFRSQRE